MNKSIFLDIVEFQRYLFLSLSKKRYQGMPFVTTRKASVAIFSMAYPIKDRLKFTSAVLFYTCRLVSDTWP